MALFNIQLNKRSMHSLKKKTIPETSAIRSKRWLNMILPIIYNYVSMLSLVYNVSLNFNEMDP